jgi:hypothetical protein
MFTVKEPMLSPAGTDAEELDADDVEVAALDDELELDDELQAAAVTIRAAARPARPIRRKERERQAPVGL